MRFHNNEAVNEANLKGELGYDGIHDSYYNTRTNEWLEEVCGDENCSMCADRPEKHED